MSKNVKKELSAGGYSGNDAVMLRFTLTVYFSRWFFPTIPNSPLTENSAITITNNKFDHGKNDSGRAFGAKRYFGATLVVFEKINKWKSKGKMKNSLWKFCTIKLELQE